ncbi:MAG: hypothetical protein LBF94_02350 [Puniceicoccales bacterium]|jgi:hypothetical protein|nr:hypothetical protein [Puniceicoccales bacterium]
MILNTFAPYISIENRTVDDLELMSAENKRTLLKNASTEALRGLVDRDPERKQVFLMLFAALGPEDVALRAKCFKCFGNISEFQDLSDEFLSETNEYLLNLEMAGLAALSPEDRRALLEYAPTEALRRLIARDRQVFLKLFTVIQIGDAEIIEKCSPFLSKDEALLPLQASIQKAIELDPSEVSEFLRSRRVGQAIAISMASFCFDELGKINPERVAVLKLALEDKGSFFYQPPCSTVPGIKLTRIQAARVLGNGELFSVLNDASDLESNDYGRQVLSLMSPGGQPPLKLNMAVLASLLSPHRQTGLPTCTIHSIINADIHNNPAIPARMMIQGLTTGVTNTPSGYILHFPPIKDGCVAVDLSRGPESEAKKILDQNKVDVQAACGIMRDKGNGKVLLLRPFDANDVLFAAYFQASLFGNKGLKGHDDSDRGTMLMRHGIENLTEAPMLTSDSSRSIEAAMEKMKSEAEQRRAAGKSCNYMRIATANSAGGHAENIDVDALLKLDPSKLKKDKPYIIGDRNWGTRGFPMHLAMVKISDPGVKPPTYRFATVLPNGKRYNWADIKTIAIYATGVKQQGSRPWRMDEFGTIAYETGQTAST